MTTEAQERVIQELVMRVKGYELQQFYKDWPMGDDWYHEDGDLSTNKNGLILEPGDTYDLVDAIGAVVWQGSGEPRHGEGEGG